MKIAVDLRPLMAGKISGVEVYITSMLKALFEQDKENEYILWYNSFKDVDISHFPKDYPNVSVKRTRIPNKIFNLTLNILRWPKVDKLIGEGIDLLWVPDPRPAPVSKKCRKIITIHDLSFEDFKHTFSLRARLWHKVVNPKREVKEADKVIAVSQFTKSQLIDKYQAPEDKIEVIYESADLMPSKEEFSVIKAKYKLPDEYFLCLSTLEPRKNIVGAVKAFIEWQESTQADVYLVIAGKECPRIFSDIKIQSHPKIKLTGFIEEADKSLLYKGAIAFIYPSFYEGFGLPILEAMKCGTPVITSDASSMPEVAGDSALMINPNSKKEIKEAIHQLYRDEDLRKELTEKGLKQAEKFSWEKAVKSLLKLF